MGEIIARDGECDEAHALLKRAVETPVTRCLWTEADAITFVPYVLSTIYGDGRALFKFTTINNRPAYWVIRGDSRWACGDYDSPDGVEEFGEFADDILSDLEDEFGDARCSYDGANLYLEPNERGCSNETCECMDVPAAEWPTVDGDVGCLWGRMNWPRLPGRYFEEHAWSRSVNLLCTWGTAT